MIIAKSFNDNNVNDDGDDSVDNESWTSFLFLLKSK